MSSFASQSSFSSEEVYDSQLLSSQQLKAGKKILRIYKKGKISWVVLLAQMQSGKTETYLFVLAEMLRKGRVENVVIFSGNAETDLKGQLEKEVQGSGKFWMKYELYLEEEKKKSTRERGPILANIRSRIQIVWGTELKKYTGPTKNTMFAWEESHFAQTKNQCPDKFLRRIGVSADGDDEILRENGNYMLSISATPFSEICDQANLRQNKAIVTMEPGQGYNSVEKMMKNGHIKYFSSVESGLKKALKTRHAGKKYAIVRISNKNEEKVKKIINENGNWCYVHYDTTNNDAVGDLVWKNMMNEPEKNTIILLKGKCRMGKNLEKAHVLFCFESSRSPKTDTLVQGLLGRVCGYSENSENIDVYISDKIQKNGELERFVQLYKDGTSVPKKGRNIKGDNGVSNRIPVSLMKIDRRLTSVAHYGDNSHLDEDVRAAFNENKVENKNDSELFAKIAEIVDNPETEFSIHVLDKKNKTYKNMPREIKESFENGTPFRGVNGCGFKSSNPLQVNLWVVENAEGLRKGDVYVDCYVPDLNPRNAMPSTTKREVFAHKLEDESTLIANGSFSINLRPETSESVADMFDDLSYLVRVSVCSVLPTSNGVHSNQDRETNESNGIYVTMDVYEGLKKNGCIYNAINNEYGVELKICKARGCVPKALKDRGLLRLASIKW
jgi:hypothetical protein